MAKRPPQQPADVTAITGSASEGAQAEPAPLMSRCLQLDVVSGGTFRVAGRLRRAAALLRAAALVLCLLGAQGCSVQLVSPFSEQIARDESMVLQPPRTSEEVSLLLLATMPMRSVFLTLQAVHYANRFGDNAGVGQLTGAVTQHSTGTKGKTSRLYGARPSFLCHRLHES